MYIACKGALGSYGFSFKKEHRREENAALRGYGNQTSLKE